MPYGGSVAIARHLSGCLILATSSDIFIRTDVPERDCRPVSQYRQPLQAKPPIGAYHEITRYARTEVLEFSEYPKLYWINARLRGQLGLAEYPANASLTLQYWRECGFTKIRSLAALDLADELDREKLAGKPGSGQASSKVAAREEADLHFNNEKKAARDAHMEYEPQPNEIAFHGRGAPSDEAAFQADICQLRRELKSGTNIMIEGSRVHGRASFMAVTMLVANGVSAESAINNISALIGKPAVDTDEQRAFIEQFPRCDSFLGKAQANEKASKKNGGPKQ